MSRQARVERSTKESEVLVEVELDGTGVSSIETGVPFFDHMLAQLAKHGGLDLTVRTKGDLEVDAHHTVEDTSLALGQALNEALGDRAGLRRYGDALVPLDEALARVAVDCSGRGGAWIDLGLRREKLGEVACENLTHFLQSFATSAGLTLHVDLLKGENDHHRAEAAFKGVAVAVRRAVVRTGRAGQPVGRRPGDVLHDRRAVPHGLAGR